MPLRKFAFEARKLKELPSLDKRTYYYDLSTRGLELQVTKAGIKTFYLAKRLNGLSRRYRIGSFPEMPISEARKIAAKFTVLIDQGKDPSEEKRRLRNEPTLNEFFESLYETYYTPYTKRPQDQRYLYERYLRKRLGNVRLSNIDSLKIDSIHKLLGNQNGKHLANRCLQLLSSIFGHAVKAKMIRENPAQGIRLFKEKSRNRILNQTEREAFLKALAEEESDLIKDYFILLLLTGARKSNLLAMRWEDLDLTEGIWTIPDTKNGEALILPLSSAALNILRRRKTESSNEIFVFPSDISSSGHFTEPGRSWRRICKKAGISGIRIHDLRRTQASLQAQSGRSLHLVGKSLGHKSLEATKIYAQFDNQDVRDAFEETARLIMSH